MESGLKLNLYYILLPYYYIVGQYAWNGLYTLNNLFNHSGFIVTTTCETEMPRYGT